MNKEILLCFLFFFCVSSAYAQDADSIQVGELENVEVSAVRWKNKTLTPATTNISSAQIEEINVGFDLPQSFQSVPNLIYSSDAGNNIGYTNMKIRGSDATRINVTINGVPFNDAESQATFFVDIADILSSTNDVQITNGIGSSSNGTGALGASLSINTGQISEKAEVQINSGLGYYNTIRNSIKLSSGRFGRYKANLRLSAINSDGYVERASSKLRSWQINQSLDLSDKHQLKLITFGANEITGQAWNGIDLVTFDSLPRSNFIGQINDSSYYQNQIDNYTQNHIQLFLNSRYNSQWNSSLAIFSTIGKGYYEEYKKSQIFAEYNPPANLRDSTELLNTETDLVRRLWLENRLVGINFLLEYNSRSNSAFKSNISGMGINRYDGFHFGRVKWSELGVLPVDWQWYENEAAKYDANVYNKSFFKLSDRLNMGVDLQYRYVNYRIDGFRDNPTLKSKNTFSFFNPKVSFSYKPKGDFGNLAFQAFIGRSSKEPIRADFENSSSQLPKSESVIDIELGTKLKLDGGNLGINLFNMSYQNQLVLTGKINDVGAYTRQNVDQSFRRGVEIVFDYQLPKRFLIDFNLSMMQSKIKSIDQYYYDYDLGQEVSSRYNNTDISFSPSRVAFFNIRKQLEVVDNDIVELGLRYKGVSKQYMDNSQNDDRSIPAYSTLDFLTSYSFGPNHKSSLYAQFFNILNNSYYSNGYSYYAKNVGEIENYNFVYPQATLNVIIGFRLKLNL